MQDSTKIEVSFSGHETFPFRLGWLHKGLLAVKRDSSIFSKAEAIVELGVGKNMVKSIRHWCLTLGVIDADKGVYRSTPLGELLFSVEGHDPYLEDPGTLWWLHWLLATSKSKATTWYYVFNKINRPEFSKDALCEELLQMVSEHSIKMPSKNTVSRDVDCFVRTYATSRRSSLTEDSLECPLIDLGLLKEYEDSIWLSRGEKVTLPDEIFLSALVDFKNHSNEGTSTVSAEQIIHGEGSPGRVFVLDENSVVQRLERLEELSAGKVAYDSTAGLRQVLFHSELDPYAIIENYYTGRNRNEIPLSV